MLPELVESAYRTVCSRWRAQGVATREDLARAIDGRAVYFAYNSGRIENPQVTYHDTREIFERGRAVAFTGDVRTLFEIQNQRDCLGLLLDAFGQGRAVDKALVLEVHESLTKGTYDELRWSKGERPGHFKRHDYVVGASETGVAASEVEDALDELLAQLGLADEDNILTVAAFFHGSFEAIHPFSDGNGRVGRALMNHLLVSFGHPPIIIYDEDKMAYYGALEAWDAEADLEPLKDFLKAQAVKTWQ